MNAIECCKTIGCNCGATMQIETFSNISPLEWLLVIVAAASVLAIANWILKIEYRLNLKQQEVKKCHVEKKLVR